MDVVTLRGMSEIRAYLRTNRTPVYFVSPTPFNLLGLDRWMRDLYYLTYYDSFEGTHGRVFVPNDRPYHELRRSRTSATTSSSTRRRSTSWPTRGPGSPPS